MAVPDFDLLARADADATGSMRGRWRTLRRLVRRTLLDKDARLETRFFCQNSGACGSHYIIDLLGENDVDRVFHEKDPDLNEIGVRHFDSPMSRFQLVQTLRYTRHNVFFEANNRLFSLSQELAAAFPNAKFIHLFRHPANAVRSAMSKPNVEEYLRNGVRFSGSLAGTSDQRPLERFCVYWKNVNQRIIDDLETVERKGASAIWIDFDDLISGDVKKLESFIGRELPKRKRPASNVGAIRSEGKFEAFEHWNALDRQTLEEICLPLFERLRSKAARTSVADSRLG